mmetsp:Transcript_1834/g.3953  ORF Transcript_1834/g.3953 Transcript_1834/m.3953 type:complete len:212 (+) Transcript_1834:137-772(+)
MATPQATPRITPRDTPRTRGAADRAAQEAGLVARAEGMNKMLRDGPPALGYTGFLPLSSHIFGMTFGGHCAAAREVREHPERDAMTMEAYTRPGGVGAAGRVILMGKGTRIDLQDLKSPQECATSLATINSARDRSRKTMSDPNYARNIPKAPQPGYNPGPGQGKVRNPALLEPAGAPSICVKLDETRWDNYRKERFAAIHNNEIPSAIRR